MGEDRAASADKPARACTQRRSADFEWDHGCAEGARTFPASFPPEGKIGNEAGARGRLSLGGLPEGLWPAQDDLQSFCPLERAGHLTEDLRSRRISFRATETSCVGEPPYQGPPLRRRRSSPRAMTSSRKTSFRRSASSRSWPTGCELIESRPQGMFIDKDIDRSDPIVITHIVIQPLREQSALAAIIPHRKARHRSPRQITADSYHHRAFSRSPVQMVKMAGCGEPGQPALGQMLVHGLAADWRHDQAGAARRAVFDKLRWRRRGNPPSAIPTGFACRNLWPASPK
jgi:hypothetical protein